ncbi:MAG: acyltransferase, partial [Bacteroidota bacterium]
RLLERPIRRLILRDLKRSFRRIVWAGALPDLPADVPVVLYANHFNFYDGYLAWYVARELLGRYSLTWMADLDAFPFFKAQGALSFPEDNPKRRLLTIRETARQMRERPETVLFYFPEGILHPPEDGLGELPTKSFAKLDRIFPEKLWWPVGIHVTWWGENLPTVILGAGEAYPESDGTERDRLNTVLTRLHTVRPGDADVRTVFDGRLSPNERWRR